MKKSVHSREKEKKLHVVELKFLMKNMELIRDQATLELKFLMKNTELIRDQTTLILQSNIQIF